jgi:hypothetical protein
MLEFRFRVWVYITTRGTTHGVEYSTDSETREGSGRGGRAVGAGGGERRWRRGGDLFVPEANGFRF